MTEQNSFDDFCAATHPRIARAQSNVADLDKTSDDSAKRPKSWRGRLPKFAQENKTTRIRSSGRHGLTLLELILSLALMAFIMYAIGMAIHLHLHSLDQRRADVEDAQLARAVLQLIAKDLRSAVQYKELEMATSGGDEGVPDEEIDIGMGLDLATDELSISSTATPPLVPGLYGTQYELQVDLSRLPRVDEYEMTMAMTDVTASDIPSDIKTVSYYLELVDQDPISSSSISFAQNTAQGISTDAGTGGLVRRELDRAVTSWAAENGGLEDIQTGGTVIAPEIVALEFGYFDGTEWLTEWDSDEMGGLPLAVEVAIGMTPRFRSSQQVAGDLNMDSELEELRIYHLVVHLPMAEPIEQEEAH